MWSGTLGETCFLDRHVSAHFPILHRHVSGNTQSVDLTTTSHCILSLGRRAGAKSLDGPSGSQCEGTIARGFDWQDACGCTWRFLDVRHKGSMAFACQVLLEIVEVMVQLYYVSRTSFFHHCLMDSPLA